MYRFEQEMGIGHHLLRQGRRLVVRSGHNGPLFQDHRGMGGKRPDQHRPCIESPGQGHRQKKARAWADPPLRQGEPVHQPGIPEKTLGERNHRIHEQERELLGQRAHGKLLRNHEDGVRLWEKEIRNEGGGEDGPLQVHGDIQQQKAAAFGARVQIPGNVRKREITGLNLCPLFQGNLTCGFRRKAVCCKFPT